MINPTRKLYSLADAVRWAGQVAEGLAYLHAANPMVRAGPGAGWLAAPAGGWGAIARQAQAA